MFPEICRGVLQVDHHGRRSRVQQLHRQLTVIGGTGHLVSLVGTPVGHFDPPVGCSSRRGWQVIRRLPAMRQLQHLGAFRDELLLPGSELLVERQQKLEKSLGKIGLRIQVCGRVVHARVHGSSIQRHTVISIRLSASQLYLLRKLCRRCDVSGSLKGCLNE